MNVLTETRLLKPIAKMIIPARTKPFNAAEFYQNSARVVISDDLADCLDLSARTTTDSIPERSYVALLFKDDASDLAIRAELPEAHLSTLEDIAVFIEAQPNGESGFLINDGCVTLFFVEGKNGAVCRVPVFWERMLHWWRIETWKFVLPEDEGGAIYQVVCPGDAAI